VRRRTVVERAMAARFVVAFRKTARREAEAERAVGPSEELAPVKADQPRQAHDQERERRERRADMPEQMAEARRERVTDRVHTGRADQRRLERAARHHRRDEAEP
jgi:hypothetical protein